MRRKLVIYNPLAKIFRLFDTPSIYVLTTSYPIPRMWLIHILVPNNHQPPRNSSSFCSTSYYTSAKYVCENDWDIKRASKS